jgi:ribonucleoside-triphosphate reductase
MLKEVVKRDGRTTKFVKNKIRIAIQKANAEVPVTEQATEEEIDSIVKEIANINQDKLHIEVIQDLVETELMKAKRFELAKKYILYRYTRKLERDLSDAESSILGIIRGSNVEVLDENSNKNSYVNSTQRDLMAGEVSRTIAKKILIPEDIRKADEDMELHWHDIDYTVQDMVNCCLINVKSILDNGTVMNDYLIESPKSFRTACNIITQVVAIIASNQYGGQSIAIKHLGKYLAISRERFTLQNQKQWDSAGIEYTEDQLKSVVNSQLQYELEQGVQTIQFQLNTLVTTNGRRFLAA